MYTRPLANSHGQRSSLITSTVVGFDTAHTITLLLDAVRTTGDATATYAMAYIACLHRVYRTLLVLFDHLKLLRLVNVECTLVRCHVAEIRLIFTSSQPPPSDCLRTAVLHFHTPIRFVAIMRTSIIARYAVANEILRRQNLPEPDTTCPRRDIESRAALITLSFERPSTSMIGGRNPDRQEGASTISPQLSNTEEGGSAGGTATTQVRAMRGTDTASCK